MLGIMRPNLFLPCLLFAGQPVIAQDSQIFDIYETIARMCVGKALTAAAQMLNR
jgi:hypothetical protein